MKTCVIIPTYNEEKQIGRLVQQIRQQNLELVVVDDGSSDKTSEVAAANGAVLIKNESNQGKGASLIKGFKYALDHGYDAVITMDGDGQHLPEDIPYFVRLATYSDSGILIGNRMQKVSNMPWMRILTNKFMSWILSCLAGQMIPDTQCGFRLIKKELLWKMNLRTCRYETESEILVESARMGFKIESVPIKSIYSEEKSGINPFVDTLRFIRFILRESWITKK